MNYYEIREQIEKYSSTIYCAERANTELKEKNMLMVSHTLERGGAPLALKEFIPYFRQEYNIVMISIYDGELRNEFMQKGLDIYIGDSLNYVMCESELWDSFDLVLLNTLYSDAYLPFFLNRKRTVLWWLHEPEILFKATYGSMMHMALLSRNIKILSVGAETSACVKKYYGLDSQILRIGIEDKYSGDMVRKDSKIRFFIAANFQVTKGQDIMAQAILDLPSEYHDRAEFIFAGARDKNRPEYYEIICKLAAALESVTMLGELSKDEVYQWYPKVDCVLAPSRMDALNMTIVEGMMFNRLCACSNATGISKYITSGEDGYVFPTENPVALKDLIIYIIDNYYEMDEIRKKGREIYLEHFERSTIEKQLSELIDS